VVEDHLQLTHFIAQPIPAEGSSDGFLCYSECQVLRLPLCRLAADTFHFIMLYICQSQLPWKFWHTTLLSAGSRYRGHVSDSCSSRLYQLATDTTTVCRLPTDTSEIGLLLFGKRYNEQSIMLQYWIYFRRVPMQVFLFPSGSIGCQPITMIRANTEKLGCVENRPYWADFSPTKSRTRT